MDKEGIKFFDAGLSYLLVSAYDSEEPRTY